ncbi:helicase-associated domain-containing protein [Nocardiopsis flavescens]|uniref:Helicase conserved C-terminal domain-containing protein n=1 Tax=Nocardiopsis flavescens TaxID=758803 RepID=A0A1M6GHF7_9ACTN|nr:helicase-associated domain-containing protein [Nocardiopsis flavescens]SHJ09417.1 Helicase conserved C-terminal domain-containing protein [Nocardiopsis flavescens]
MTDNAPPDLHGPGTETPGPGRPPTFTSWLRERSDAELAALLSVRPDLGRPLPDGIGALAARATSRNTVLRALEGQDAFTLQVLEAVVALGDDRLSEPVGATAGELADALAPAASADGGEARRGAVADALQGLLRSALVWSDRDRLRPVQVLRDLLPAPARLGPPARVLLAALPHGRLKRLAADLAPDSPAPAPVEALARLLSDPAGLGALLEQVGEHAHRLLDGMAWGPPHGTVADARRDVGVADAGSPVEELLARALLLPSGDDTLTLPREVGLHLRAGALFRETATAPPGFAGTARDAGGVDGFAAGQAFTVLRAVEELLESWSGEPAAVLRNGGLGVRDLRRAAAAMETDEATAALYVEVAHAAGLLGADDRVEGEWLPTREYDLWRESPPERRWLRLAQAWLDTDRVPSLSGSRDSGGRVRNVLGPGLVRPAAPQARRDVLAELATADPGFSPVPESLSARLSWRRPRRRSPVYTELVDNAVAEAALLGFTGRGALAGHVRPLLEGDPEAAAALLAGHLPRPLDHVLVQGDLTAVAPGPLVAELARELALIADVESTGGATVYRFTEDSVRRGLDAGRGIADILTLLERHSRTPLPQALRYLVSDVGRRHGRLRAGAASSYLRCDEPALLDEVMGDRRTEALGLVRLAPTVVAAAVGRASLVDGLRRLGHHPVAEGGDGVMRLSRPEARRAEPVEVPPEPPTVVPTAERVREIVRAVRAGDEAATATRHPVPLPEDGPPGSRAAAVLAALARAAEAGRRMWIGYTDTDGRQAGRIIGPSAADGGFVTAHDETRGAVQRFAVHRITALAELEEDDRTATP